MIQRATVEHTDQIRALFYQTVTTININDYTPQQIAVWSAGADNVASWTKKIAEQYFLVALKDSTVVGFASITNEGYLDFMFVHALYQKQGIATALLNALILYATERKIDKIWADVSITARPFFAANGFTIDKIYTKIVQNIDFENAIMTKKLTT